MKVYAVVCSIAYSRYRPVGCFASEQEALAAIDEYEHQFETQFVWYEGKPEPSIERADGGVLLDYVGIHQYSVREVELGAAILDPESSYTLDMVPEC